MCHFCHSFLSPHFALMSFGKRLRRHARTKIKIISVNKKLFGLHHDPLRKFEEIIQILRNVTTKITLLTFCLSNLYIKGHSYQCMFQITDNRSSLCICLNDSFWKLWRIRSENKTDKVETMKILDKFLFSFWKSKNFESVIILQFQVVII